MRKSMEALVADAATRVDTIAPDAAQAARQDGDLVVDIREPTELESDGEVAGAVHSPPCLLESRADPETGTGSGQDALVAMRDGPGRIHILYASGARATLAADSLRQMGYEATVTRGGLTGWKEAGLPVTS